MRGTIRKIYADSLFRNSFYLMLNTGTQAGLGFFFWLIAARLFTPDQIGVATSLISAMSLISYMSLLGFNSTFVRFLPTSKNRDNEINTGLLLAITAAVVIGAGYVWLVPHIAPRLAIIHENIFYAAGFIALVALCAINVLTDSIFVAFRGAKYNLLIDGGIQGITKLILPFVFVGLGAYGIFLAAGSAAALAMIASIFFLIFSFQYRPRFHVDTTTLKNVFRYSFSNYIANLLNIAPTLVLPLIVINHLGSASSGYYYLAFAVANLLYAIAFAVSQSFFAEGSYDESKLWSLAKRSLLILAAIMIPAGLVLAVLGSYILHFFGSAYSQGGAQVIVVLALASPAVAACVLGNTLLRIKNKVYSVVLVNVVYFVTISGLALLWVDRGLIWIAFAWMAGNAVSALVAFAAITYDHFRRGAHTLRV